MPQPMQQLLFTFGLQQAGLKWGNIGKHYIPIHFSPPHTVPSVLTCPVNGTIWIFVGWRWVILTLGSKVQRRTRSVCSPWWWNIPSRWICQLKQNVFKYLNVIIVFSPFLLAQRLWSFLVLLQTVDLLSHPVDCIWLILAWSAVRVAPNFTFLTQPVASAVKKGREPPSLPILMAPHRHLQHSRGKELGMGLKVTKGFSRESYFSSGRYCISRASLPHIHPSLLPLFCFISLFYWMLSPSSFITHTLCFFVRNVLLCKGFPNWWMVMGSLGVCVWSFLYYDSFYH